jgi:mono/diheme cytochrome c family protein
MRFCLLVPILTVMVGTATGAGPASAQSSSAQLPPAVARGADVAQKVCSRCHAVALEETSRERDAPLFRVLSRLYSAEALETKLTDIAAQGHFEMPRVTLTEDEISDVSAYIASLQPLEDKAPRREHRRVHKKIARTLRPASISEGAS